ncbi:unnamed protein product, partial [Cuscuta europaea]
MGVLNIPVPIAATSIRSVLIAWWLKAGSKKLEDVFKHNLPRIISWNIWKVYTSILWDEKEKPPIACQMIQKIKCYTQQWALSLSNLKLISIGDILFEENLIPRNFKLTGMRFQLIKWFKPKAGFKLNTDAAFSPGQIVGGAIMRDSQGKMCFALRFPLNASSL